MSAEPALAVLLSSFSLRISESSSPRWIHRAGMAMAGIVIIMACIVLYRAGLYLPAGSVSPLHLSQPTPTLPVAGMSPYSALGFLLLSLSILQAGARKPLAVWLSDISAILLCALVMILVSGYIFGASHMFGPGASLISSPVTLLCLTLLSLVIVLRRMEMGVLSIFLGDGLGSRFTRILGPFLLLLPYLREGTRARLIGQGRMPPHYITAILVTISALFAIFILLYLARQINRMEWEIRDLSLRDELTALYNRKGFYLLAEQALRMAHRSNLPFSVLYIDVDNLKQINDSLGHSTGSEFLSETAQILQAALREADVVGRIGGDEFAVAAQLGGESVTIIAERLRSAAVQRNRGNLQRLPLSFSIGYITSKDGLHESLDELLARADEAMYHEKRSKKQLRLVR